MTAPRWYLAVSGVGVVWNVIGVFAFVGQFMTDPESLSTLEREFFEATPIWAHAAFGVAVFSGTFGCIALLARKSWAYVMLLLCAVAIVIQISHSLLFSNGLEVFGAEGLVLPALTLSVAVALAWLGRWARDNDVLVARGAAPRA